MDSSSSIAQEVANYIAECGVDIGMSPHDITWADFKKWLIEARNAGKEDIQTLQQGLKLVGGFNAVKLAMFPAVASPGSVSKELVRNAASINRSTLTAESRDLAYAKVFEDVISRHLHKMAITVNGYAQKKPSDKKQPRILNLFLSDDHIGARLDGKEVMHDYGPVETSRRFAKITQVVCNYKRDHRSETHLNVILGGDIIQGMLGHDPRDGAALAEQWCEALWILTQVLARLASEFPSMTVHCTSGNHDRNTARHKDRALHQKWDSHATTLYYALKTKLEETTKNVKFVIPLTPWIDIKAFGHRIYGTHGDTNLNVGNPSSNVNVASLISQMSKINIGEVQAGRQPFSLFVVGHIHFGGFMQIPGGYYLITNPALIHRDSYGLNFGHGQAMGQSMWETTENNVVGDYRLIDVDFGTDLDVSLDAIVKPFRSI